MSFTPGSLIVYLAVASFLGLVRRLTGWLKRLAEANDRQLGGIQPVCCGAHIDHRKLVKRPAKEENSRNNG